MLVHAHVRMSTLQEDLGSFKVSEQDKVVMYPHCAQQFQGPVVELQCFGVVFTCLENARPTVAD